MRGCCRLNALCASGSATSLAPKMARKKPQNRWAPRDPALPSLHDCIVIASLRPSNPVFVVFAPSDLQLHIFARLVIGRTLAPLRKWEPTAPSQTRQRLRHNPDAIVIVPGGFQRC